VTTAQPQIIKQPMQLILIINLNVLNFYISAPTVKEATRPHKTVMPHSNEVNPGPNKVVPYTVPIIDPNPTKLPSIQKNVTSSRIKFLIFNASAKLVTKLARFCSYIATRLGGFLGFSLMIKNSGTVIQVIQMFWITIRSTSFSLIY
jgi:hypothetical protein